MLRGLLIAGILALFGGCQAGYMGGPNTVVENGCKLDVAARMAALNSGKYLKREGVEYARMLDVFNGAYGDGQRRPGHTYLIYMSPPGANRMWQWDARGSARIRAWKDDPDSCAKALIPPAGWGRWCDDL